MKMRDRAQRMTNYPKEKIGSLSKLNERDPRIRTLLDRTPSDVPPSPSSTSADTTKASGVAAIDANVPPLTTSDDLDIRRILNHVLIVQAAHGKILVDVLDDIRGLRAKLA